LNKDSFVHELSHLSPEVNITDDVVCAHWPEVNLWLICSRGDSAWRAAAEGTPKNCTLFFSCLLTNINNPHDGNFNCLALSIGVWNNRLLFLLRSAKMCNTCFKSI